MFDNLTKEIFIYSLIPAFVIALICIILIVVSKKKGENAYKFNYAIKVLILLIVRLVLPLITGYSIWVYERMVSKNILASNIFYLLLLIALIIALIALLIAACYKLFQSFHDREELEEDKLETKEEFE